MRRVHRKQHGLGTVRMDLREIGTYWTGRTTNMATLLALTPQARTRAWEPLTRDVQIIWLVKKLETAQVHFTL